MTHAENETEVRNVQLSPYQKEAEHIDYFHNFSVNDLLSGTAG